MYSLTMSHLNNINVICGFLLQMDYVSTHSRSKWCQFWADLLWIKYMYVALSAPTLLAIMWHELRDIDLGCVCVQHSSRLPLTIIIVGFRWDGVHGTCPRGMSDMKAYTVDIIYSVHMPASIYSSIMANVNISNLLIIDSGKYLRTISPQ